MPIAEDTPPGTRSFATALSALREPDHPNFASTNEVQLALRKLEEFAPASLDELWWDAIEDAKGHLSASAANNCGDNEEDQERSIAAAEAWVAENLSALAPSSGEAAALIVWAFGAQQALARLAAATDRFDRPSGS
jgi:hypothetical protein